MSISLKVEGIAGSSIEECAKKMLELSKQLNIMIEMDFNGHQLLAMPNMDIEDIIGFYEAQIKKPVDTHATTEER